MLNVRDLAASRSFYVDALGFVVSDEDATTLYLRGVEEACHHSLVLKQTVGEPRAERIGMRTYTEDDLERLKRAFDQAGLPAVWVDLPFQGRTLHLTDVVGSQLEICAHMDVVPRKIVDFVRRRGPTPQRIDHYQLVVTDVQRAAQFYTETLGFRLSEYVARDGTDDLVFVFLQRKGNPHDIVFGKGDGPRLHHFAYSVPEISHLFYACDSAGAHGFGSRVEHGPGRHGPGHAIYVYFRDPDGHRVELFNTHYQTLDSELEPLRWDASYLRHNRAWGVPARRSWWMEASAFTNSPVEKLENAPEPYTLEQFLEENHPFV